MLHEKNKELSKKKKWDWEKKEKFQTMTKLYVELEN